MVKYTFPDGVEQSFDYNEQSFLEAIPGFVNNIDYMALGKRSQYEAANGVTTTYQYDRRQRLERLTSVGQNGATYQDWRYQLDGLSNILRIDDLRPDKAAADDDTRVFAYDSLQRLMQVSYSGGERIDFGYDSIGNMTSKTSTMAGGNLGEMTHGENAGPHALTSVNGEQWRYDATGNLEAKPGFNYLWDHRNLLLEISGERVRQLNRYDYSDRRTAKRVIIGEAERLTLYPDRSFEVRDGKAVKYFFANSERIAKVTTPFDQARLIRGFHGEAGQTDDSTQTNAIFYHGDHLGSASILVDEAGQLLERRAYHPFGSERTRAGTESAEYSFTGKEFDEEVGLYYYGARYYDPDVGHFISADLLYFEHPEKDLVDPQALNLYSYVRNNPMRNIDPDGRDVVIAYGVGDQQRLHRSVANKLASQLRKWGLTVKVIKANQLKRRSVRRRLARRTVSAAIFVGHGNTGTIGYKTYKDKKGRVRWGRRNGSTPNRFAKQAGVERGGVVGFLSCNVVNGDTKSEVALARRGINSMGFVGKVQFRSKGSDGPTAFRAPDPHINLDNIGALPKFEEEPWVSPDEIVPDTELGAHMGLDDDKTFGERIEQAEKRVN